MFMLCLGGAGWDALGRSDMGALERLALSHGQLLTIHSSRLDTSSDEGIRACARYLTELEEAMRVLGARIADRSYRKKFTKNYRQLFSQEGRNYRVDVLEASVQQHATIWVNGEKFEFSGEVMRLASALQWHWDSMSELLNTWTRAAAGEWGMKKPLRSQVQEVMTALDFAWSAFEQRYIAELIQIEQKAREMMVEAIEHQRNLDRLDSQHGKELTAAHKEEQRHLVACLARLNSVANSRRKGRDDLSVDVLHAAMLVLQENRRQVNSQSSCNEDGGGKGAAVALAVDVVESFDAFRWYLREVGQRGIELIDPHLSNNEGLVSRLVDWEESWELGNHYLLRPEMLTALCDLVSELKLAQEANPEFADMCAMCDVDLFLVLPRIVWLCFLTKPALHRDLLKNLLPHRFSPIAKSGKGDILPRHMQATSDNEDHELKNVRRSFWEVSSALAKLTGGTVFEDGGKIDRRVWKSLLASVVSGFDNQNVGDSGSTQLGKDFMRELEKWSIELQRHCPQDWNQCSAVLIQCISQEQEKCRRGPFRV
eukprot:TRINITY_DN7798_c0_g1_i2.p1 TRINITY_DN7798_c0_g1~~TRINITY_DN7798_c0_g1_i2.p1  ORF type:complete len:540 (-),score=93.44 TRINITY_DN7798_c0_g1_i2:70-1689(-)